MHVLNYAYTIATVGGDRFVFVSCRECVIAVHRAPDTGLIDVHTHAIDVALPDLRTAYPGDLWPTVEVTGDNSALLTFGGEPYRRIDHRCWSPAARLADMDRDGVAMQVLSPIPVTFCYDADSVGAAELATAQNEFFAGITRRYPDRFVALGAVAMQDPDGAVVELRRCMHQRGFIGVEIATQICGTELADPSLDRFFAVASELGAFVFVHPSDQDLPPRMTKAAIGFGAGMPTETGMAAALLITSGALQRRPDTRLCFAHGAGTLPSIIGRLDKGARIAGTRAESAELPSRLATRLWCDSLTYHHQALVAAIDVVGDNHVVLGSDYPFPAMPQPIDDVVASLPPALRRKISRTNAEGCHGTFLGSGNNPLPAAGRH